MIKIENKRISNIYVPYRLIFNNEIYQITNIHKKYVIKDLTIKTVNRKIEAIELESPHPNSNPRNGEFCIPDHLRNFEVNEKSIKMIELMICCFNLDDCYFTPWDEIEYKKQEVVEYGQK